MFFNSIEETNRLRKEMNKLLSKGMSKIYLKVTIQKKYSAQNVYFIKAPEHEYIFLKYSRNLNISGIF